MLISPVDDYGDLFRVESVCPDDLVQAINTTDWPSLSWQRQEGQENWRRRLVDTRDISWIDQWDQHLQTIWPGIASAVGRCLKPYSSTAWWLDEGGFTCSIHTDGEMPGAMQLTWLGASPNLGTAFYHHKTPDALRYQFPVQSNSGYIMINQADPQDWRHLQWHGMLTPVPDKTYRLTSYTWIYPC